MFATRSKNECKNLDDVACLLCGCGHQDLVVEQREKLRREGPAFDDFADDARAFGLGQVVMKQTKPFTGIGTAKVQDVGVGNLIAILKEAMKNQLAAVILSARALEIDDVRMVPANLLERLGLVVQDGHNEDEAFGALGRDFGEDLNEALGVRAPFDT